MWVGDGYWDRVLQQTLTDLIHKAFTSSVGWRFSCQPLHMIIFIVLFVAQSQMYLQCTSVIYNEGTTTTTTTTSIATTDTSQVSEQTNKMLCEYNN